MIIIQLTEADLEEWRFVIKLAWLAWYVFWGILAWAVFAVATGFLILAFS